MRLAYDSCLQGPVGDQIQSSEPACLGLADGPPARWISNFWKNSNVFLFPETKVLLLQPCALINDRLAWSSRITKVMTAFRLVWADGRSLQLSAGTSFVLGREHAKPSPDAVHISRQALANAASCIGELQSSTCPVPPGLSVKYARSKTTVEAVKQGSSPWQA